ncbi:hypothetical protein Sfulv_34260 [Streptomyces fulvorobeus]|uniref:Futalosine hydrolase n=1 Tax=Streptomyces fulvorobeus TaxID=284028 RepID=A0A7J0C7V9_9ACTN|nr:hypothetical protein Sfulv_34260 [Streptomyces fulvorobeus]
MRVLVVTAVPVERDAVTRAFGDGGPQVRSVPGAELHRAGGLDVLAGGAGPAAAAASAAFALAAATVPYALVVSAGIGGGFPPAPPGSLVVASAVVAADLGRRPRTGSSPSPVSASGATGMYRRPLWYVRWHRPPVPCPARS